MPKPAKNRPEGVLPPPASIFHAGRHEPPTRRAVALRGHLPGNVGDENHATGIVRTGMKENNPTGRGFDSRRLQVPVLRLVTPQKKFNFSFVRVGGTVGDCHPPMESLLANFRRMNVLTASSRQVSHNERCVGRFLRVQGITCPNQITRRTVQDYAATLLETGLSPKTVRNHQAALSRFCTFLVDQDLLSANPIFRLACCKLEKLPPLFLNDAEYEQALKIARDNQIYVEVCLALKTGTRLAELRMLQWQDIDWSDRTVLVRKSKSKKPRRIPLHRKALIALRYQRFRFGWCPYVFPGGNLDPCRNRRHWARRGPRKMEWWTTKALKPLRAEIGKFSQMPPGSVGRGFHLLRHTFATRAVRAGIPIKQVSTWLGHAHVSTTEIYAHMGNGYSADIEKI